MWNEALFLQTLREENPALADNTLARMADFASFFIKRNETLNLSAITQPEEVAKKHFADSLSLLPFLPEGKTLRVIDVGTGGGFPGVPLLIARPQLSLTLLDSTKKKLLFVEEALTNLGLSAKILHARAEEAGHQPSLRESYDLCVSRAVADLPLLSEYCLPFVRKGGLFIAMKGAAAQEEIRRSQHALRILGADLVEIRQTTQSYGERALILIKKTSQSPTKYPRPSAQSAKHPL